MRLIFSPCHSYSPFLLLLFTLCVIAVTSTAAPGLNWHSQRQAMVKLIEQDVAETVAYIDKRKLDTRVMQAMATVPRHEFVPLLFRPFAYRNRPLAIGYGQTISQPFIVALMTDLLAPAPEHKILEVGTGSGYQAAILSQLAGKVYSIEIIHELAESATQRLKNLGHSNIKVLHGDGYYGWQAHAPFDSIIVTAVGGQVPPPLLSQLKPGGRMVLPVGEPFSVQYLLLVEKSMNGVITTRQVLPVRFVPLTGKH